MKRSTFGMRRSKGQGHVRPEIDLDAMAPPDIILNPLQSSRYSSSLLLELFLKNKTFTVWWLFFAASHTTQQCLLMKGERSESFLLNLLCWCT